MPAGRPKRKLNGNEKRSVRAMCAKPHTAKIHVAAKLRCDVKIVDRLLAEAFEDEIPGCTGFADVQSVFFYETQSEMYEKQLTAAREGDSKAIKWFCDKYLGDFAKPPAERPKVELVQGELTDKLSIMRSRSPVSKKRAANE